jgi:two-component system chemotaxis response regulator CheB
MINPSASDTPPPTRGKIRVALVDDSVVIRGALARIIERQRDMEVVGSFHNGEIAINSIARIQPDIVILDIEMPVMDGLTALPKILAAHRTTKVIMFSSLTEKGAATTLKAMQLGAVECLVKPHAGQQVGEGSDFEKNILELIRNLVPHIAAAAGSANSVGAEKPDLARATIPKTNIVLSENPHAWKGKPAAVLIGSSTGGPQALFEMIRNFKDFDIPILLTQHMPATFTKILADHIRQQCGIPAQEGSTGMTVQPGQVYVAPGGFHMLFTKSNGTVHIVLDNGPPENFCKPAVDPMFRSAIEIYGSKLLGVILTGMGSDGLNGGRLLVERGGRLIAQDEQTSVV